MSLNQILLFIFLFSADAKFICKSGENLTLEVVCNGRIDCEDASDERKELCLHSICSANEFKCFYGACIPRTAVCNHSNDCADGSDETQCGADKPNSCSSNQFRCDNGVCIESQLICNDVKDCPDGSDESKYICEHQLCPTNTFRCRYGSCIAMEAKCNGFYDCIDGTDELQELCQNLSINCPAIKSTRLNVQCENTEGIVACNEPVSAGTIATYSCREYFLPKFKHDLTNNQSICQSNGVWSRDILKCEPECGKTPDVIPLITNGVEVSVPFPWHATMYVHKAGNYTFWCGASLITEALFITAAHCVFNLSPEVIKLALGKFRRQFQKAPDELNVVFYDVKRIIKHPLYMDQIGNYASDIAVLEVVGSVTMNDNRLPVCVDWNLDDITSHLADTSTGVVMGMGMTETDQFSDVMQKTTLQVVDNEKCIQQQNFDFRKYISFTAFCAGWMNGTGVCNGDSGGGLVFPIKATGRWCLQGIVSLSPRRQSSSYCDPFRYTVFTKVGMYVKWIQHIVEEVHATHNFTPKRYEPILSVFNTQYPS